MPRKILTHKATDSRYFHRDFHILLNMALDYLGRNFGQESVREYLEQFAEAWYSPLKEALQKRGLVAVKEHYESIYRTEGADYDMRFSGNELVIRLKFSPAVEYIQAGGNLVSRWFRDTVGVVNRTICKGTDFDCDVQDYSEENGGYVLRFFRRAE